MLTWDTLCRFLSVSPGSSATRLLVLSHLAGHKTSSITALAEVAKVRGATMHGVVVRLEKDGLIKKTPSLDNARERICQLTAEGRREVQKMGRRVRLKMGVVDDPKESLLA